MELHSASNILYGGQNKACIVESFFIYFTRLFLSSLNPHTLDCGRCMKNSFFPCKQLANKLFPSFAFTKRRNSTGSLVT